MIMPTTNSYRSGFEKLPITSNSFKVLNILKDSSMKTKLTSGQTEAKELRALRFKNFISIKDIVQSSESGLEGVILNSNRGAEFEKGKELDEDDQGSKKNTLKSQDGDDSMTGADHKLRYYVPLSNFHKTNDPIKRALVVGLENLPSSIINSDILIDSLLTFTIEQILEKIEINDESGLKLNDSLNKNFSWTFVNSDYLEKDVVFIEFEDILTLYLFKILVQGLDLASDEKLNITVKEITTIALKVLEDKTQLKITEKDLNDVKENYIMKKLDSLCHSSVSDTQPQDKLNALSKFYSDYEVDPNELLDVPSELIEHVKNHIINFRLHVFKLEKEKKEQQALNDKRNSRMKLKRLYNDLQTTDKKRKRTDQDAMEIDNDSDADSDNEIESQRMNADTQELTDEEAQKLVSSQENARIEKTYQFRLQQVRSNDSIRAKNHANFLNSIKHEAYINSYIPSNRERFLKMFVEPITSADNKIDANINYYVNHSNYLKFRKNKKIEEERADNKDREEEMKEGESSKEIDNFVASFGGQKDKPVKISLKRKTSKPTQDIGSNTAEGFDSGNTANADHNSEETDSLPAKLLPEIKGKISSVIVNFLGMKEDSLTDFISTFVMNNYYRGTETSEFKQFVVELGETLDEDALVAIFEIYKFVETLL